MKLQVHRQVAAALIGAASLLGMGSTQAQVTVTANPWYNNVTVGAPLTQGVYGQIVLGNASVPPPVYSSAPVIIERTASVHDPMYLYVPPGHRKKWSKHCSRYNACSRPVYFVNAASPRAYAVHGPAQRSEVREHVMNRPVVVREPVVVNRPVVIREQGDLYHDKHERKEMRRAEKEYDKQYRKAVRADGKHRGHDNDQGWSQGNNGKHLGWERGRGNKHGD